MGVFLTGPLLGLCRLSLPHARGGVSIPPRSGKTELASSPRTWGCFRLKRTHKSICLVFPTHVGVFLGLSTPLAMWASLPHARGGVSEYEALAGKPAESSPRTWGCFWSPGDELRNQRVFPTHVGVFLVMPSKNEVSPRLPHARGGVSMGDGVKARGSGSSPRTWGCFPAQYAPSSRRFVFPTHVGVFPLFACVGLFHRCLPHARGGVSETDPSAGPPVKSSPRTWGCFPLRRRPEHARRVFPTHVGVFLPTLTLMGKTVCLPHARGGVS